MPGASQAVSRRVVAVEGARRLSEIAAEIERQRATHCVVLAGRKVRGVVRLRELASASALRQMYDLAVPCPVVEAETPLAAVAELFRQDGVDGVAVERDGAFFGLITPESLFQRLLEEQTELAAERTRSQEAIAASERQLRLVTDSAPIFIVQLDRAHRFTFVNRGYAQRHGREIADTLGRHLAEVVGSSAYELLRPRLAAALEGQELEFDLELSYPSLGTRWMHFTYVPERRATGEVSGLVAVIRDTTEQKRAERAMQAAHDRALAASRAKDEFIAALSHELRTPLQPVLLLASAAADNGALPAEIREDFAFIRRHIELEARLIDDLLDLTRITRDKLVLDLQPAALAPILQDALEIVRGDLARKRIALAVEPPPSGLRVSADAVRLQQVFWNVLKNAVKFTPASGRIRVETALAAAGDRVTVRISDTGIGLRPEELEPIFAFFAQGEHARDGQAHRFGGLGLGLAISRKLVELHGGRITAASDGPQRGAAFAIELPVLRP